MITVIGALAMMPMLAGQDEPKVGLAFETQLKMIVVFKEGFGFFVREGTAQLENGWATTNLVPRAVRGTLWVYPQKPEDRVETIILTTDNRIAFENPEEIYARLSNKVGLRLRINTEGRDVTGKLTALLDDMLLLKEESGNFVAIEYEKIETISLVDFPVLMKLITDDPNGEAGIGMAYIQEGVLWEPSYLLELLPEEKGRLTLRGTLLNLPEELKDANVVFVVGAPTLINRGHIDSLLAGFMSGPMFIGASPGVQAQMADVANRALREKLKAAEGWGTAGAGFGALPAEESGELQYYTKTHFSLRPGERAMTTIFEIVVPVTPLFDWNADTEDVIYILTIENESEHPLTTGPVFVVEDERPVGQQMVKYTPPGGKAEMRLAKGIGLRVKRSEIEVKRGDPFKVGERQQYLPITMKGTLTLENFRDDDAEVRVTRTVRGKVLEIMNDGVIKDTTVLKGDPNSLNVLEWKITVPAGEKLDLTYTYETYTSIGQ
ncbi:MAG: hypothetical protein IH851_11790 [Armatimonadetes bacterium]|nr:hypothetical protein [Armatimonadota bacterium]